MRRSLFHLDDVRNSFSTLKTFFPALCIVLQRHPRKAKPLQFIAQSPCFPVSSFVLNYTPREQKRLQKCYLALRQPRKQVPFSASAILHSSREHSVILLLEWSILLATWMLRCRELMDLLLNIKIISYTCNVPIIKKETITAFVLFT